MIRSRQKTDWKEIRHRFPQLLAVDGQGLNGYDPQSSTNHQMQQVFVTIHKLESYKTPCLIVGEEGTGKQFWARFIHQRSYFRNGPFIVVESARLLDNMVFGQLGDLRGKLEQAWGGTLYITEINCLSLPLQLKLLKVIRKQYPRIRTKDTNGNGTLRVPPLRIIAGTKKDLRQEVVEGRFNSKLYYRLTVFPIYLPPLRQRPEDILPLASHFMEIFAQHMGKAIKTMSDQFKAFLLHYLWPGNVDELRDFMLLSVYYASPQVKELSLPWFQAKLANTTQHNYHEIHEEFREKETCPL